MRAVVQRVKESKVVVKGEVCGSIKRGVMVLLGVEEGDTEEDVKYMAMKIPELRIFPDDNGAMNLSLMDINGEILVVSQFTLLGDVRKGRRPSFTKAAPPDVAKELYFAFIDALKQKGIHVETGVFQEMMDVYILNEGPVTLLLDSRKNF